MNRLKSGYEVIFIMPEPRRHEGKRVYDWIIETAKSLGIGRMTQRGDVEGTGADGKLHSAHFFDLADQPISRCWLGRGGSSPSGRAGRSSIAPISLT